MKKYIIVSAIILAFTIKANAQLKIFTGGDITIGNTTAPASGFKLHVQGNSLFSTNSFSGNSAAFIRGLNGFSNDTTPDYTWWGNDQTGFFHPGANIIGFTTGGKERMRLTATGNLLIGNTNNGGWRVTIDAERDSSALAIGTNFTSPYGYAQASYVNHTKTKSWIVFYNGTENFSVWGNGDVWAYNYYNYSDSILKENIVTLANAKTKILALRGVSYNFKPQVLANPLDTTTIIPATPPKTLIGLIAEEVEQVVPEVVETNDNGIRGISSSSLTALLIEAFKEQNFIIQDMQAQLDACCSSGHRSGSTESEKMNNSPNEVNNKARLDQNNPNPFSIKTEIHFYIPESTTNKYLLIFDMQGTLLKHIPINPTGESSITIQANEFRGGMNMYTLIIDGKEVDTKRMILTN